MPSATGCGLQHHDSADLKQAVMNYLLCGFDEDDTEIFGVSFFFGVCSRRPAGDELSNSTHSATETDERMIAERRGLEPDTLATEFDL